MSGKKMGLVRVAGEIIINRPIEIVFDFVADESNEPHYNPSQLFNGVQKS
jgi:hypothetical protein